MWKAMVLKLYFGADKFQYVEQLKTAASVMEAAALFHVRVILL